MKIERVNDCQIRCTLTKEDLASRQLKISELAYGTEKAKDLFRDMMQQANYQFGFDAEDIPLMIEAVPINSECIILIITKVEDPEELDTRFANFSPSIQSEVSGTDNEAAEEEDVMDLFQRLKNESTSDSDEIDCVLNTVKKEAPQRPSSNAGKAAVDPFFLFSFATMHDVMKFAQLNRTSASVRNTLYKSDSNGRLYLLIHPGNESASVLQKLCSILSEYGRSESASSISEQYLDEHYQVIIKDNAIQKLSEI
ncbi:adapter protein MecA 1/2 [Butyrivibrio sp. ob235]|uniref:adaptor protein MecA n=1 Tax=Butyrivibrio sp. ob235 TaxID=1761780 RepID=UPI0008CC3195|nr:adaptor protein MecA [Butyrivibrio sp. ob235]SEM57885.1 adapter protein MecA 1/2 [Butyrivibrio sp. ob235]